MSKAYPSFNTNVSTNIKTNIVAIDTNIVTIYTNIVSIYTNIVTSPNIFQICYPFFPKIVSQLL